MREWMVTRTWGVVPKLPRKLPSRKQHPAASEHVKYRRSLQTPFKGQSNNLQI